MARKKKARNEENAQVPISAMIDVVFLLLVYFIFTAKEVVDEVLVSVNLPGPPNPNSPPPPISPTLDIYVHSDSYEFQGTRYDLETMTRLLMGFGTSMGKEATVNIKVSIKARHESLVLLLDGMKLAGLEIFNIHTLKPQVSR